MATKFDFLSPGVNIREIDNSVLPAETIAAGPILIGRSLKGPGMQPIRIRSYEDFVDVFGAPVLGSAGSTIDVWRDGNQIGPQYAGIAAQAHLASDTTPITFVRLLGDDSTINSVSAKKPGWTYNASSRTATSNKTAYGLFLINSASAGGGLPTTNPQGGLAAVFYVTEGFMALSGALADAGTTPAANQLTSSTNVLLQSVGSGRKFKLAIYGTDSTKSEEIIFDFDKADNSTYIRNQFNTNPILTNSTVTATDSRKTYWLGETFDRFITDQVTSGDAAGDVLGILMPLVSGSATNWANHEEKHAPAQSGWVFAQDTGSPVDFDPVIKSDKLFRFVSLHGADQIQKETMIGISEITLPVDSNINPFGTFSVQIMDLAGNVLEEFRNVDLNPSSDNYIVKLIGDTSFTWSDTEKKYNTLGTEPNSSNYFRVEVSNLVDNGGAQGLVPFGFFGPVRPRAFSLVSGSSTAQRDLRDSLPGNNSTNAFAGVFAGKDSPFFNLDTGTDFVNVPVKFTGSFKFPKIALRSGGTDGSPVDPYEVFYGIRPMEGTGNSRVDSGYSDYVRRLNATANNYDPDANGLAGVDYEYSFAFSMDDLVVNSLTRTVTYTSGSRVAGTSRTATSSSAELLDLDIQQFSMPVWGGFDGFDITESEPFRAALSANQTTLTSYVNYSLFKAVDSIRNSEQVIANSISIPGQTTPLITDKVISMCEDRKDLLGIIDLENGYTPSTEATTPAVGNVGTVISSAKTRKLNSSYACTFYPWVQIRANTGVSSGKLWAPPSVAAIGAFASSDRQSDLWFAPAGFTRGGLNPLGGTGGPGVVNVDGTLTAKERDKLYKININPIASFPGEGIVVFGQKTLQSTPSALDRINVRRLLIYLKGELSRISRSLLFEPNVTATWLSFKSQADQVLSDVKANFGVTEYKIVLDETTTTADLIDRNILYAKVFIKPTRAIEYIVVDLIVTNTGAEFV
jgi:hypothetical protein